MQYTMHYIVLPRPDLVSRIEANGPGSLEDLMRPTVWTNEEADRSYLTAEDRILFMKVLFLATLIRDRADTEGFMAVFGDIKALVGEFDKWWMLVRVMGTSAVEELEDAVDAGELDALKRATNPSVAKFLDHFIAHRG